MGAEVAFQATQATRASRTGQQGTPIINSSEKIVCEYFAQPWDSVKSGLENKWSQRVRVSHGNPSHA